MKIQHLITHKFNTFIGIPILFLIVLQFVGFDGLYGQDSYEYLRYTRAIQDYIIGGPHPESFYWPVLYPFLGSLLGFTFGNVIMGLQLLTAISFSLTSIYLYKTIHLLYPKNPSLVFYYVLIFGLLSPYFLKSGLVVMSDVLASMFIIMTFYHFFKSYQRKTSFSLVFFFATCALMTRYATLLITLPVILLAIYFVFKRRAFLDILIGGIFSILVCIPFIILQMDNLYEGTSNYFLKSWSFLTYFKSSYETIDGMQSYGFPNLIFVLSILVHPGFIFIGAPLTGFTLLKLSKKGLTYPQNVFLISIITYFIFLAGIPFQNIRVLGLLFPLILLFFYPAFKELTSIKWIVKYKYILGITCIIIQLALWSYTFKNVYIRTSFEKQLAHSMTYYQGKKLYSFDVDISLEGRGLNFDYKNMYLELYNDFKKNDLILFHPTKFAAQWKDKNPMLNWNRLQKDYILKLIKKGPDGWNLYQIIGKR